MVESVPLILKLREWQTISPTEAPQLAGYYFREPAVRDSARRLTEAGQVELLELRTGLTIQTRQFVGSLQLGDLRLTILPKISGMPLLNLLRYAYHLRQLDFFTPLDFGAEANEFQDLLIQQIALEAAELLERGLHRRYERVSEKLLSPRGRIDFGALARQGGVMDATLPCAHFVRLENNLLNQCLLAGLELAARLTNDLPLRAHLRQSIHILDQSVDTVSITARRVQKALTAINRLTMAYQPALKIIQILLESQGLSLESDQTQTHLPGFLFDMNRFFQALLDRFLRENLVGYSLRSEYRIHRMLSYHPQHNPFGWGPPTPRPDFAVLRGQKVLAFLDAKYREIGQTGLPREMLYQLALYAISQGSPGNAAILYPTVLSENRETWLEIAHPVSETHLARIILRPVNLYALEQVITSGTALQRAALAYQMAFGS